MVVERPKSANPKVKVKGGKIKPVNEVKSIVETKSRRRKRLEAENNFPEFIPDETKEDKESKSKDKNSGTFQLIKSDVKGHNNIISEDLKENETDNGEKKTVTVDLPKPEDQVHNGSELNKNDISGRKDDIAAKDDETVNEVADSGNCGDREEIDQQNIEPSQVGLKGKSVTKSKKAGKKSQALSHENLKPVKKVKTSNAQFGKKISLKKINSHRDHTVKNYDNLEDIESIKKGLPNVNLGNARLFDIRLFK